jgi:23S rRNA (pseudouridine1915-N3)-methyltransferase
MRLILAAVGRLKDGAERDLFARYAGRLDRVGHRPAIGPLSVVEITEGKATAAGQRRSDEAARLLKAVDRADMLVALDRRGKAMTSEDFARWLSERRDGGVGTVAFLIGGPDGHGEAVLKSAAIKLSLGAMTLPHGLARIVFVEQLYRASTILAGHPYHRT